MTWEPWSLHRWNRTFHSMCVQMFGHQNLLESTMAVPRTPECPVAGVVCHGEVQGRIHCPPGKPGKLDKQNRRRRRMDGAYLEYCDPARAMHLRANLRDVNLNYK